MTDSLPAHHPLRRLFTGTVHHVFYVDVGMCDPQVADYVADLLSKFIHMDDFYPFRDATGQRIENLAEVAAEAYLGEGVPQQARDRAIYQHIGDFSLFWTGVFPEGVRRMHRAGLGDQLSSLLAQGKRSYAAASELTLAPDDEPPAGVLKRLSDHFEHCVYGLHLCRKEWEALPEGLPPA